jgi:hypothetical protein
MGGSALTQSRDVNRREVLRLIVGVASMGLGGCCSFLRPFPSDHLSDPVPGPFPKDKAILRPPSVGNGKNAFGTPFAIDVHGHFFNGTDLNASGYVEKCFAHTVSEPLRSFIVAMAPLLDELACLGPTAKAEFDYLQQHLSTSVQALAVQERETFLKKTADDYRLVIATRLHDAMVRRHLDEEFLRLRAADSRRVGQSTAGEVFDVDLVLRQIDPMRRREEVRSFRSGLPNTPYYSDAGGTLEFFGHMLAYRWMNLRDFQYFYTSEPGAFGIDCVFGSMVDFDYWLDPPPISSRHDQILLHSLLSRLSDGYVLPIVPYNPWTDINRGSESFKLVKDAIEKRGYIGMKVYPPVGFYAYDNVHLPYASAEKRPDPSELDKRLLMAFKLAASDGTVIMAHAGDTMGRDSASDQFGGPPGWTALFNQMRQDHSAPAIVNLGHFGGDVPETPNEEWPKAFGRMMHDYPEVHLYGDVGYWDKVRICPGGGDCDTAQKRLEAAIAEFPGDQGAKRRIMYGSDWHMLSREQDWGEYAAQLASNLTSIVPAQNLFYKSAMDCFGLGAGGAQRQKVMAYLGWDETNCPDWFKST